MNAYAQQLIEMKQKPSHILKDIGDQWQTPKPLAFGLFAHFSQKIGAIVLDLFANEGNQLAPNFYTAEINAMTQDWAMDLKSYGGAAFANPPYSRPYFDEDGTPITGIEHVIQYCREQREKGAKIMLLLKAATSDGWWPEDADFIQFVSGRIGFQAPAWYVPTDLKKDKPSSSGFASAVIIFDKDWAWERRPVERLSRHVLEMHGQMIIDMIESRANAIVAEREQLALDVMSRIPSEMTETEKDEPSVEPEINEFEPATEQLEEIVQTESDAIDNDNYQLPFVAEPEEDYSDKTIEQIYEEHPDTWQLTMIMLSVLFGRKGAYAHREIQFAGSSLLTDGEMTRTIAEYENAKAINEALTKFSCWVELSPTVAHFLVCGMLDDYKYPANKTLTDNLKLLERLHAGEEPVLEALSIEAADTDVSTKPEPELAPEPTEHPVMSREWLREKYMQLDDYSDCLDSLKEEIIDKTIQAIGDINDEYSSDPGAPKAEEFIDDFFASSPCIRTYMNIRSLRAAFRNLVSSAIKDQAA
jgi:phage N-6-adenine-methyltransferase